MPATLFVMWDLAITSGYCGSPQLFHPQTFLTANTVILPWEFPRHRAESLLKGFHVFAHRMALPTAH